jgi:hypothetical protein
VHWDGIEYYAASLGRGVLYVFRGSSPLAPTQRFRLRGLDPAAGYTVTFHDATAQQVLTGRALMRDGVSVTLARPLSSELVFFERLH